MRKGINYLLFSLFAAFIIGCNTQDSTRTSGAKNKEGIRLLKKIETTENVKERIELTHEALAYAQSNSIDTLESESFFKLGVLFLIQHESDSAKHYLTKAQSSFESLKYTVRSIMANATLINHHCTVGDHQNAMRLIETTDRIIADKNEPSETYIFYYLQKVRFYYEMGIQDSVLWIANHADSLSKAINSTKFRAQLNSIKGVVYADLGKDSLAIESYKNILDQYGSYEQDKGIILTNLGNSYARIGSIDSSIHYYKQALHIYEFTKAGETTLNTLKMDMSYGLSKLDANLSNFYFKQVDSTYLSAKKQFYYRFVKSVFAPTNQGKVKALMDALSFTETLDFPSNKLKLMCYSELSAQYSNSKNYKEALEYFEKHTKLNAEMKEEESFFKMEKLSLINSVREKDRKIQNQGSLIVEKDDFILNQNIKIYLFAALAILMLLILLLLRKNYKTKIKLNALELQRIELTKKLLLKEMDPISYQLESANETIKMAKMKLSKVKEGDEKNQLNNVKSTLNQWLTNFQGNNDTIAAQKLIESDFLNKLDKFPDLTESEKKVIILIKQGYKSKEISDRLNLALNTVEIYRSRIRKKLNFPQKTRLRDGINKL